MENPIGAVAPIRIMKVQASVEAIRARRRGGRERSLVEEAVPKGTQAGPAEVRQGGRGPENAGMTPRRSLRRLRFMDSFEQQRQWMVDHQIAARDVRDPRVLEAMRQVPRERFVPQDQVSRAYEDAPLPIGQNQTISQPYIVALMIEAMDVGPEDRVLEVGAGSGYTAALLSRLAKEVYSIERHPTLTEQARQRLEAIGCDNVTLRCGDGSLGWAEEAPFDAILVSAGGPQVPQSLQSQLAENGRLVIPVGDNAEGQELWRIDRRGPDRFERRSLGLVRFVPLIGREGWGEGL